MASEEQIDAAVRYAQKKREGKKKDGPDKDAFNVNLDPLYLNDSKVFSRLRIAAAYQLVKELEESKAVRSEDEFYTIVDMLELGDYIEYGRSLYDQDRRLREAS